MISIFAIPKAFQGHNGIIQRNAIESWTLLKPTPEILLYGDDSGTEETAKELGVRYMGTVERNEYGTPLVQDLFHKAREQSTTELLCYANSDIILMNDFNDAYSRAASAIQEFVMTGQRWDMDIQAPLDFTEGWERRLMSRVESTGRLHEPTALDYFIFPRKSFETMPPFAIGRPVWDNWFLYHFRVRGFPVIDATSSITVVHQDHDYNHVPARTGLAWEGPEADRNRELCGGYHHAFTLSDRTHRLTRNGLIPVHFWENWHQRLLRYSVLYPEKRIRGKAVRSFLWRLKGPLKRFAIKNS